MHRRILLWVLLTACAAAAGGAAAFSIFAAWDLPEVEALEEFKPSVTSRIYSDANRLLAEFFIENRKPVSLADAPEMLLRAVIAVEDARFYEHHGIDFRGIARAFTRNIRAGKILEGGSTLTQQLSKVLFLTPERSYTRKFKELILALRIEQRYTKKEILSLYLNQIYFGNGAYGIEAAAQTYFGKSVRDLSLAECALLAGLPRSPKKYSPFQSRDEALSRRAYVLNRMAAAGIVTKAQADEAKLAPFPAQPTLSISGPAPAPYFIEYIRQKVEERFGTGILYSGGLHVYTSINDRFQSAAEQAVRAGLAKLDAQVGKKRRDTVFPQAALVAVEPATGYIKAMVGGRDFSKSQFNRAWQALRQPGSAFKPILYAAALERGFSPADILSDAPLTVKMNGGKPWNPENFTRTYRGPVTLRKALAQSLNVPTVRLLQKIGIRETVEFGHALGIKSPLTPVLSLALGSSDVTLLELTSAYAVFANHGVRIEPSAILSITDSSGRVLYSGDNLPVQAMSAQGAYLTTMLLKGVIEQGTGWKARGLGRPLAGKTGTTNDYRDAWFIGYSPALAAGVWVGFDDQRTLGSRATGSKAALPVWTEFMKQALADQEPQDFIAPPGIIFRQIDPRSGLLSTEACPATLREAFLEGTEPKRYCEDRGQPVDEPVDSDEAPE